MSIYSIGLTALQAAQMGQQVTGNNIANVNTTGYRRQEIVQETAISVKTGSGFLGQGVSVDTVRRIYDDFLERQVSLNEAGSSYYDQYLQGLQQIDNVLGDRSSGVSSALQEFFASWNNLANNPSSTTARQSVLGAANTLANSINGLGNYLDALQDGVNTQIRSVTDQVNSYAASIAKLNVSIGNAQSSGQLPNDLLDQRDQLVSELNQLVGVSVLKDSGGNYSVFMGSGYQLVSGATSNPLVAGGSFYDPSRLEVYGSGQSILLSGNSQIGGKLGGLLDYRSETLDLAQNSLGRIGIALASGVNALHTTGRDPAGNLGGVFFDDPSTLPQAFSSSTNSSAALVTAAVTDAGELTTSDYKLSFNSGTYTLTRLSDGQSWSHANIGTLATNAAQGFSLSISVAPDDGDSFLIRPTAAAATNVGVAITDPSLIAVADASAAAGDILDNRNALAIAALQYDRTLIAGSNTLESSYAVLVGEVGNKTSEVEINQESQLNLLTQARQQQQSASGVNLDEEAANLIRYQQAYQAAAKLIATATTMFDALLELG
jgi:flagellar hook-associated protein 1 FlgK